MPDAVKRTVRLASIAYVDADGRTRRADRGQQVEVHPDSLERFDNLNGEPEEADT
ncbi:hypothetical protein LX12_004316, partial [Williamsia serinedens]|nr:hypothetical protein [Williamsia serinedens]